MELIPAPPKVPSPSWLLLMALELIRRRPSLPLADALRCAELAHDGTWLLDAAEAAEWWLLAIGACARDEAYRTRGLAG
ncbi:MAG: hypothetical protein M3O01_06550 [Pseudomonadota bacterium]|nr:hypothetical protein [Pseudomonadota bacterium]